ncbi:bifunctional 2-polyprenyl-6-hydroxyphenol methylase/3-demethylubiquinol 3-O-methyltransferase UbiG [Butyrivibrio sp. INlla16]|uniref:class I SAM-dependent methyltransferase n=1 Tax=Butyrivibrio sp. INlla16 TaxID=1520807 RepID=UPI00087EA101|nr:class I SAM-dependent methyltransferase [Butyrivibrio sp. INlla16]SDB69669.1 Methyltransferase domain-containing protein [Butyrivibrio sp. INlla16]
MSDWGLKKEYLHSTRQHLWNDDYFEFLVKSVWKINKPVRIIDFGCGYGYLAQMLMPLIPDGSSYKGIDISEELIKEANGIFESDKERIRFEVSDLNEYVACPEYDVVICQAVLRHIPNPVEILDKMIGSAKSGGLIICIEPSRRMENSGIYLDSTDFDPFENDDFLRQKWIDEIKTGGRDYQIGLRIPAFMKQLGLTNIGVRINDYVDYVGGENKSEIKRFLNDHSVNPVYENSDGFVAARCQVITYGYKQ